jgi:UDP-glucose 4-epimerase
MKYLVLGGAGFQGRHLVEHLLKNGGDVRVFDRAFPFPEFVGEKYGRIEYISGDFNSVDTLDMLVKDTDVIFHLISTTLPKTSNDDPVNDVMTNIVPTIHFLESARKAGVRKIIYFSSGGTVYGIPKVVPIPEDHPTLPLCSYGIHKVAIEHYLHLYFTLYGLDYAVMRVSNPYGVYQSARRGQGVVSVFLHKLMKDEAIDIWGDGLVVRDYIHVDDVIGAALRLVDYQGEHKVFNIGSGRGLTLNNLITDMESILGRKAKINYLSGRAMDVTINVLDISQAFRELGWQPRVLFRVGVSQVVKALQEETKVVNNLAI